MANTGSTPVVANRIGNTVVVDGGDPIMKPSNSLIVRGVTPADPAYANAMDSKLIYNQLRPQFGS